MAKKNTKNVAIPKLTSGWHNLSVNHLRFFDQKKFEITLAFSLVDLQAELKAFVEAQYGDDLTVRVLHDNNYSISVICESSKIRLPSLKNLDNQGKTPLVCPQVVCFKIQCYVDRGNFGFLYNDYWGGGPKAKILFDGLKSFCQAYFTLGLSQKNSTEVKLNTLVAFCSLKHLSSKDLAHEGLKPKPSKLIENLLPIFGALIDIDIEENKLLITISGSVAKSSGSEKGATDESAIYASSAPGIYSEKYCSFLNVQHLYPEIYEYGERDIKKLDEKVTQIEKQILREYALRNQMLANPGFFTSGESLKEKYKILIDEEKFKLIPPEFTEALPEVLFLIGEVENLKQHYFYQSLPLMDYFASLAFMRRDYKTSEYFWKIAITSGISCPDIEIKLSHVTQLLQSQISPVPRNLDNASSKIDMNSSHKREIKSLPVTLPEKMNQMPPALPPNFSAEGKTSLGSIKQPYSPPLNEPPSQRKANIDWRKISEDNQVTREVPEQVFLSSEDDFGKHMGLQVTSLISGEMSILEKWQWPIWQDPSLVPYPIAKVRAYPKDLVPKLIRSHQDKALRILSRVFSQYFYENFSSHYLMVKLRVDHLNLNKMTRVISLNEGLAKDAAMAEILMISNKKIVGAINLKGLGSEIFYHNRTRAIYIDMSYYQKAPVSYLFHRLFVTVLSVNLGYYNILRLDPLRQLAKIVHMLHNHFQADFIGRLSQVIDADSKKLSAILKNIPLDDIKKAVNFLMPLSTKDWMSIHQQMWQHLYIQALSMHLDLVGLLEYLTQKKLREKNVLAAGEIYSLHSLAPQLIKLSCTLEFLDAEGKIIPEWSA